MPCPFLFEKTDKRLNANFVNKYQPVVAANLNHLLQILSLYVPKIISIKSNLKDVRLVKIYILLSGL